MGRLRSPWTSMAEAVAGTLNSGRQRMFVTRMTLVLTVTHIFLLWAKDLISLVDLAAPRWPSEGADMLDEARHWAGTQFATADLGDARRTHRLVSIMAAIARAPNESL